MFVYEWLALHVRGQPSSLYTVSLVTSVKLSALDCLSILPPIDYLILNVNSSVCCHMHDSLPCLGPNALPPAIVNSNVNPVKRFSDKIT